MKIGLFYEDKNSGELFMCDNFTYTKYQWINSKGERITEEKTDAWKHMSSTSCKDKKRIKEFLKNLNYQVMGLCYTCNKTYFSKWKKYKNERACGDEFCSMCGSELKY